MTMSWGTANGEGGYESRLTIADLPQNNVDDDEQGAKYQKVDGAEAQQDRDEIEGYLCAWGRTDRH